MIFRDNVPDKIYQEMLKIKAVVANQEIEPGSTAIINGQKFQVLKEISRDEFMYRAGASGAERGWLTAPQGYFFYEVRKAEEKVKINLTMKSL